jgi:hypothetical protein
MTVKDIDTFLHKYIGSEDEKKDLKNIYIRFRCHLDLISQSHIAFDEDRTRQLLLLMIRDKEVHNLTLFSMNPLLREKNELRSWQKRATNAK